MSTFKLPRRYSPHSRRARPVDVERIPTIRIKLNTSKGRPWPGRRGRTASSTSSFPTAATIWRSQAGSAALGAFDFELTIDRHSIPGGDEWEKRLGALISDAGTVVFVVSPSSFNSKYCKWEIDEALRLNKRILPVLCRPLYGASPPKQLASRNYIYLYADPELPGSGFGVGLVQLVTALRTDLDWLREHTDYLRRANNWGEGGRPSNRLLSGPDVAAAKAWLARRPKNAPEPTDLQLDFVKESGSEELRRQNIETRRAEREKKLARRAKRVSIAGGAFALCLSAVAIASAFVAHQQREFAERELNRANESLGRSIISNLDLRSGEPLSERQRNEMWKLSRSAEPVKHAFVSILVKNPEETIRVSSGFTQIARALGLLWPPEEQMELLVDPLLKEIRRATSPEALVPLAYALEGLASTLNEAQAGRAIAPVLQEINKPTTARARQALAGVLQALPVKLSETQAYETMTALLKQIDQMTSSQALSALGSALQALAAKLNKMEADHVFNPLLRQMEDAKDPDAVCALASALQALAPNLDQVQAGEAVGPLLAQIRVTTDFPARQALASALKAIAPNLNGAQAAPATEPLLKQIQTTNPPTRQAAADALESLPVELSNSQASQALQPLLGEVGQTRGTDPLQALCSALKAVASKLTETQASQQFTPLLQRIGQTADGSSLRALGSMLQGMAPKLVGPQASQAVEPLLRQIDRTTDPYVLQAMMETLHALPTELSKRRPTERSKSVLKRINSAAFPSDLLALTKAVHASSVRLSEPQADQALKAIFDQLELMTNPLAPRPELALALKSIATKLPAAQAEKALVAAASSLGWSATAEEATLWAAALAALTHSTSFSGNILATVIAYPTAAGEATEILLDAIRAGRPDVPAKDRGTESALEFLVKAHPQVLHPVCPPPPQAGLQCPPQEAAPTAE